VAEQQSFTMAVPLLFSEALNVSRRSGFFGAFAQLARHVPHGTKSTVTEIAAPGIAIGNDHGESRRIRIPIGLCQAKSQTSVILVYKFERYP
jgi:hypothetical protein